MSLENRMPDDWCYYHNAHEPDADGPVCGECFHQFASDDDLLAEDIRVRREMGQTDNFPTSAAEVFCCPFCVHDL